MCRGDPIRTGDFLNPNQARYQTAPHPAVFLRHGWEDSNLQRAALETAALPIELHPSTRAPARHYLRSQTW
jgi:hypothetical protein